MISNFIRARTRNDLTYKSNADLLFVCFDALHTSEQVFSHVWMGLSGMNQ